MTRLDIPLIPLMMALALAAGGGCGGGGEWAVPPVSALPVWPGLPEPEPAQIAAPTPATPPAPSPIAGDLPADLDGKLTANASCAQKECAVAGLYPALDAIDGKAPAAVWSHEIAEKGQAITLPKHGGVDVYGVTLKGSVSIKGVEGGKSEVRAGKWVAFHAPGAGVSVTANEPGSRVLLAVVGAGSPIADVAAELRAKDAKKLAWKTRPAPIETADLGASKDLAWAKGAMHARIGFEGAAQKASLGILIGSKDAPVAPHTHDGSWEVLAALRADGNVKRAAQAGSTDLTPASVTDGSVVAIPKAIMHAWEPAGSKPLIAVQLYVPAGPEQRFKKLAESAGAPK